MRAVAKSVKSAKSKLAFGLQTLFLSDVEYTQSRKLPTITGVRVLNAFPRIRASLENTYAALYAAELVLKSTPEEEGYPELFDLFVKYLTHLDTTHGGAYPCADIFALQLLALNGYGIRIEECASCNDPLTEQSVAGFSNRKGGFLCPQCAERYSDTKASTPAVWKYLRGYEEKDFAECDTVPLSLEDKEQLKRLAQQYASYILERNLNTAKYL